VFEITLEGGHSIWVMIGVAIAAIAVMTGFYWRAFGMLRPSQWRILVLLRAAAIIIIVLLLFRPVFSFYRELKERPALILLLDRSRSMSIADTSGGLNRFEQARQQIQVWWPRLEEAFDLRLIAFADRAQKLEGLPALMSLQPDGEATSLARALDAARYAVERGQIEAAIMLSDGIHNAAGDPQQAALRVGFPVHTVGVGATLRSEASYRDIQFVGLDCPERMMLGNRAKITASVEAIGLAGRVVQVTLEEDGERIEQSELVLDDTPGSQEVAFEFIPTRKGRHTYRVWVSPVAEEKIAQNNERSAVALVVEPGIRVLYLEGTLRTEYGAIVERFLSKDPDVQFCALVRTKSNQFMRRTNIEGLELAVIPTTKEQFAAFDVFIIGDLDSSFFRPQEQRLMIERIREGAGLVMLGGYHSLGPGGYGETPLGADLPVDVGTREVGQITEPFLPELTPEGANHPIFANIADFFPRSGSPPRVGGLPNLSGCTRVRGARPGASVLAVCPLEDPPVPVLAVQPVGKGRTAVFTGDTTRNWQQGPRALDLQSPFLQFWGQLVRWLAGRAQEVKAEASIVASTDKAHYEPGELISVSAIVRDEQGEGTDRAKVTAEIRGPGGRPEQLELAPMPGPGGHYSAPYEPKASGTYELAVHARLGEMTLNAEKLIVEVGRPNLEFEKLDLNEESLAGIAAATGGRCVHISSAHQLIEQLDRSARKKRVFMERPLFSPLLFWGVFVGLLTTEWFLRRRFQLR